MRIVPSTWQRLVRLRVKSSWMSTRSPSRNSMPGMYFPSIPSTAGLTTIGTLLLVLIARTFGWVSAKQEKLNSSLTLVIGYQYCIRITNYTPDDSSPTDTTRITATPISGSTTVSASAFPTGQISPPGPTQSGQPSDCIEWHVAESKPSLVISQLQNGADTHRRRHLHLNRNRIQPLGQRLPRLVLCPFITHVISRHLL